MKGEGGKQGGGGVGGCASLALNFSLAASLSPSQSGRHREGPRGWVCDCIVGQGAGQAYAIWIRLFGQGSAVATQTEKGSCPSFGQPQ